MTKYIIRKALHEEANEGWVWISGLPSRAIVRISNPVKRREIFCQVRKLDDNFRKIYNDDPRKRRFHIINADTIVMSQWFRDGLGEIETTDGDNKNGLADLEIVTYDHCWRWWGSVRAAAHHPEIIVRIGVSLGVLGFGLGLVGLLPTLLEILGIPKTCQPYITLACAILVLLLGGLSSRRPKPIRSS
jgi:hypothetical protein